MEFLSRKLNAGIWRPASTSLVRFSALKPLSLPLGVANHHSDNPRPGPKKRAMQSRYYLPQNRDRSTEEARSPDRGEALLVWLSSPTLAADRFPTGSPNGPPAGVTVLFSKGPRKSFVFQIIVEGVSGTIIPRDGREDAVRPRERDGAGNPCRCRSCWRNAAGPGKEVQEAPTVGDAEELGDLEGGRHGLNGLQERQPVGGVIFGLDGPPSVAPQRLAFGARAEAAVFGISRQRSSNLVAWFWGRPRPSPKASRGQPGPAEDQRFIPAAVGPDGRRQGAARLSPTWAARDSQG